MYSRGICLKVNPQFSVLHCCGFIWHMKEAVFYCIYCDKESCVLECSTGLTSNNAIMVNQIAPVSEAKLSKVSYLLGNNKWT